MIEWDLGLMQLFWGHPHWGKEPLTHPPSVRKPSELVGFTKLDFDELVLGL